MLPCSALQAIKPARGNGLSTLYCRVEDCDGHVLHSGNVFLSLTREDDENVWNTIRFDSRTESYVFRTLPGGSYTLRVSAAQQESASRSVVVETGASVSVTVRLSPKTGDPLILDRSFAHESARGLAAALWTDSQARRDFTGTRHDAFSDTSRILVALLDEAAVLEALCLPIDQLNLHQELATWMERQIRSNWSFRTRPEMSASLVSVLVENRLRLWAVARAVFANPCVSSLFPAISAREVHGQLLRFFSTLDSPELDGVLPILAELFEPRLAIVDRFARALVRTFDVRLPKGVAQPMRSDSADAMVVPAPLDGQLSSADEAPELAFGTERARAFVFRLSEIAAALEGARQAKLTLP